MNSSIHLSLNSKDQGHKTYQGYYRIYCCFNTPPPTGYIELILRCLPKFYSLLAHFAIGTYTYKINSLHYPFSYHVKTGKKLGHEIVFKRKHSQKVYSQQSHILIHGTPYSKSATILLLALLLGGNYCC
jgi:hypothetical protein